MLTILKKLGAWILIVASCFSAIAKEEDLEFFEKRIRPVLAERCYSCHSADAEKLKSELFLDSKEGMRKGGASGKPAIVPGDSGSSRLIEAIRYANGDLQMPPQKAGGKLNEQQIADFVAWVNMGAPDPRTNAPLAASPLAEKYKAAKKHWAFQPVKNPVVPSVKNTKWGKTSVDNFILAKLEEKGLSPSAPADKRTLIRRAYFDLTGLPPTYEEVEAFVNDKSSNAFAKIVDRLLASPRYGERWGRYWLDIARFADTKGYVYGDREETKFVQSAAYRDWVVRSLNADLPYDQFLKLQIAADQIEGADRDSLAAMGYLTLGRRFLGVVHDIIDDRIDVVMRGTQALTVGCARCHDHKFDPIPTKDYYSLYGVFAGCSERTVPLNGTEASAKGYLDFEKELKKREEKFRNTFNTKREEQSQRFRAKTTDYLVAVLDVSKIPTEEFYSFIAADEINPVVIRAWNSYLLNSAKMFHRVWAPWHTFAAFSKEDFEAQTNGFSMFLSSTNKINPLVKKAFKEKLPGSMREVAETYGKLLTDVDKKWSAAKDKSAALTKDEEELRMVLYAGDSPAQVPAGAIVELEWYFDEPTRVEIAKLAAQIDQWIVQSPGAPPHAVILEDNATQKNPRVFKRGNPANKGDEVLRQFPEILSGEKRQPFAKGSGRLELAQAIASKDNPLTARVLVNRVWAHHFGAGLVRTPSDFGTRAEPPSHPELLDWLSSSFMGDGWSVKKLHRLIMLSAVYQQSSESTDRGTSGAATRTLNVDPENKLLSHFNRQRLDFESLRDSLLSVSGQLDLKVGGKAEELFKPPFSKRRSIYGFIDRQFLPGAFRVFDFASPDMHSPQRSETTIPQQALFFMNGPFVAEQAKALAARISPLNPCPMVPRKARLTTSIPRKKSAEEKIHEIYRLVLQREPTSKQLKLGSQFLLSVEAEAIEETKKPTSSWKYGYGEFDEAAKEIKNFESLPYFNGDAWQGGKNWPDEKLGWAQITATGGHAGNYLAHAVIRRWISPVDGNISIEGMIKHEHPEGQGVRAYIFSNRNGLLGKWILHNQSADGKVESVEVKKGDAIDFIVSIHESLSYNDFLWAPTIRMTGATAIRDPNGYAKEWNAQKEFSGTLAEDRKPLTAWEKYAQALLLANEFLFVD
ncbi:MAG: Protein of unknown function (DUF1553)/Protein of unknown function (DUF1549)/Planctomycete [Verrucomicrobiales bacterium]|nr:Protein of unknown function (DUF1553)/Protein of unknown function (DUF1549)/Planctomycete [Verrucomicrobiales bacterium]